MFLVQQPEATAKSGSGNHVSVPDSLTGDFVTGGIKR